MEPECVKLIGEALLGHKIVQYFNLHQETDLEELCILIHGMNVPDKGYAKSNTELFFPKKTFLIPYYHLMLQGLYSNNNPSKAHLFGKRGMKGICALMVGSGSKYSLAARIIAYHAGEKEKSTLQLHFPILVVPQLPEKSRGLIYDWEKANRAAITDYLWLGLPFAKDVTAKHKAELDSY
ncbi:MAG: hypothetical protein ABIF10_07995 [Candidatus Woesearchaeota archaeon]